MRISVAKLDPGEYYSVLLDGEFQPFCIEADEEAGYIITYETTIDHNGEVTPLVNYFNELVTIRKFGKVKIIPKNGIDKQERKCIEYTKKFKLMIDDM